MEALYFNAKDGFLGECPLAKIAPFDLYFLTTAAFLRTHARPLGAHDRNETKHAEAILRGFLSELLTTSDYNNLCQCETLDDLKLQLVSPSFSLLVPPFPFPSN